MMDIRLLRRTTVETVVLLSKGEIDSRSIQVELSLEDMDLSGFQLRSARIRIRQKRRAEGFPSARRRKRRPSRQHWSISD